MLLLITLCLMELDLVFTLVFAYENISTTKNLSVYKKRIVLTEIKLTKGRHGHGHGQVNFCPHSKWLPWLENTQTRKSAMDKEYF